MQPQVCVPPTVAQVQKQYSTNSSQSILSTNLYNDIHAIPMVVHPLMDNLAYQDIVQCSTNPVRSMDLHNHAQSKITRVQYNGFDATRTLVQQYVRNICLRYSVSFPLKCQPRVSYGQSCRPSPRPFYKNYGNHVSRPCVAIPVSSDPVTIDQRAAVGGAVPRKNIGTRAWNMKIARKSCSSRDTNPVFVFGRVVSYSISYHMHIP